MGLPESKAGRTVLWPLSAGWLLPLTAEVKLWWRWILLTLLSVPMLGSQPVTAAEVGREAYTARFLDWHPSERRMLIVTRSGTTVQLEELDESMGVDRQLTSSDELVSAGRFRPGNAEQIVYAQSVGGRENYQLFLFDRPTGASKMLTDGVHRHSGISWSADGRRLATSNNSRNGQDMDVYVIDPDADEARRITEMEKAWTPRDWSLLFPKSLLIVGRISDAETRVAAVDASSARCQLLVLDDVALMHDAIASYLGSSAARGDHSREDLQLAGDHLGTPRISSAEIKARLGGFWLYLGAGTDSFELQSTAASGQGGRWGLRLTIERVDGAWVVSSFGRWHAWPRKQF